MPSYHTDTAEYDATPTALTAGGFAPNFAGTGNSLRTVMGVGGIEASGAASLMGFNIITGALNRNQVVLTDDVPLRTAKKGTREGNLRESEAFVFGLNNRRKPSSMPGTGRISRPTSSTRICACRTSIPIPATSSRSMTPPMPCCGRRESTDSSPWRTCRASSRTCRRCSSRR